MPDPQGVLNTYGDRFAPTTPGFGADISSQRLDALDEAALAYAWTLASEDRGCPGVCVDLGCGRGEMGARFAELGLDTLLLDILPREHTVLASGPRPHLEYLGKNVRQVCASDLPRPVDLLYSQRFIHYLRYEEARQVLKLFRSRMPFGAKLFLSASGLDSELSEGYCGKHFPAQSRFTVLSPAMQERHGISSPVCLYRESELTFLCEECGFEVDRSFISSFGNVKTCCRAN